MFSSISIFSGQYITCNVNECINQHLIQQFISEKKKTIKNHIGELDSFIIFTSKLLKFFPKKKIFIYVPNLINECKFIFQEI